MGDIPCVIDRLDQRAEQLRSRDDTDVELTATVAAIEKHRVAMLRLRGGDGSVAGLTTHLRRAREIGRQIDRHVEARDATGALKSHSA